MTKSKLSIDFSPQLKFSLLDTYIVREIIVFFLLSVGIFSSLGVAVGTISDLAYQITEYSLPIETAIQIFLLNIPEFTAYALPISILLATLLTYGRLSKDSELIALKCLGISIYRLVTPALIFSLIVTAITFGFNEFVVPAAHHQAINLQKKYIQIDFPNWQKQDLFYPEYNIINNRDSKPIRQLKRLFYIEGFDGNTFYNLTILSWSKNTLNQIITCETAQWNNDEQLWDCFQVKIEYLSERNIQYFIHRQFPFTQTLVTIAKQDIDLFDMNIFQAQNHLKLIKNSGDSKKELLFRVRIQQKIAFPFICFVFAGIGSSIGAGSQQINRARGFGLCVGIVFSYYLLAFLIGALGLSGILSPVLAAWIPNFLALGIGAWLLINNE